MVESDRKIAADHLLWAERAGLTQAEILRSIGLKPLRWPDMGVSLGCSTGLTSR